MAPKDIVSNRGHRGDRCDSCGWTQIAEQTDDTQAHVVYSKYFQMRLCGHCLDRLLTTIGKLRVHS